MMEINYSLLCSFRNDVTHYTGQLAKDTSEDLKELNKFPIGDQVICCFYRDSCYFGFTICFSPEQALEAVIVRLRWLGKFKIRILRST